MSDPLLFDDRDHPALMVLSALVEILDGNGSEDELRLLADDTTAEILADYHGNVAVFEQAWSSLQDELEPRGSRAELAERRNSQAILGRERLHAARMAADRLLAQQLRAQVLLPTLAGFLCEQWRQSLIQTWLRDGPDSQRYRAAIEVGDRMVRIDAEAAQARGRVVADGLIALQQRLRDCYVACGLDESGATALIARVVAELANPDAARAEHEFTPHANNANTADSHVGNIDSAAISHGVQTGQMLLLRQPEAKEQLLRLAWISPLSQRHLLVNRMGAQQYLMPAVEFAALLEAGRMLPRPLQGTVQGVLAQLDAELQA